MNYAPAFPIVLNYDEVRFDRGEKELNQLAIHNACQPEKEIS